MRPTRPDPSPFLCYAVALLAPVVAFLGTYLTWPLLRPTPWPLFFAAVMASAWCGGLKTGLFTTAIGAAAGNYFFLAPYNHFSLDRPGLVGTAAFVVVSVFIALLATARRRAETFERAERRRFQATMTSIADAVIATDATGRITFMNGVAEAMTGWTSAEARGKPLEDVFVVLHQDTGVRTPPPVTRVMERGPVQGLARHAILLAKDGAKRPVDDSAAPIRDDRGKLMGVVLVFRDTSERKRVEEALRQAAEANAKFRAMFEQGTYFAAILALDGVVVEANRLCYEFCGFSREEVVGKPFWKCGWWNRSTALVATVEAGCARAASGQMFRAETHYFHANGSERFVDLTLSPVADDKGRVVFIAVTGSDVTDRRNAEDELRKNDRRKDEFLAMLAHELRNPLAAIGNAMTVTSRGRRQDHIDWALEVINRQTAHLTRLIDDLLDVSRINSGKIELRNQILDASAVLDGALATVKPLAEERQHVIDVAIDRGRLWVEADPTRLEQVVTNLLTNAVKYTEDAGHIWLNAACEGDQIVIRVKDTGIGIPPAKLPEMFELFAQGNRTLARSEGGLGLGLTIVKKLVEMHGGSVQAGSGGEGAGSEFIVRLPAAQRPAELAAPAPQPAAPARTATRILVVDDNVDTAAGMARLLRLLGHAVKTAHDGVEAVAVARTHRPEVVLLDIGLPGMDGYEVAAILRTDGCCGGATFIAISGYGQEDHRRRSREAGFDHHFIKPLDHDALLALLAAGAADRQ